MPVTHLTLDTLASWLRGVPMDDERWSSGAGTVLLVDLDRGGSDPLPELHTGLAAVVVGLTANADPETHPAAAVCDVVLDAASPAVGAIVTTVEQHPVAATALALLLRGAERRSLDDGLMTESAVYSALQAGPEFAAWRAAHPPRDRGSEGDPVSITRSGGVLEITLDRPLVRNALSTSMRDQLVEAFRLPWLDPSITEVHLRGAGEAFCGGGDLDEFGSRADPATAHLLRLQQSVGRAIAEVSDRVTAHLHGACVGSGVELPAFAGRVVAHPSTVISLPEVGLGLVPGAGGTVSLPRRIGRRRTARLALTGERIDAHTAREWGLVDVVADDDAA